MNTITVIISDYESKYFPVKLDWKVNGIEYSNVFENDQLASDYIFDRYSKYDIRVIDKRQKPKRQQLFKRGANIPKQIRNRTYYNMKHYYLDLYDAFKEAVSALYHIAPKELQDAWYHEDFRDYIPSAYID